MQRACHSEKRQKNQALPTIVIGYHRRDVKFPDAFAPPLPPIAGRACHAGGIQPRAGAASGATRTDSGAKRVGKPIRWKCDRPGGRLMPSRHSRGAMADEPAAADL